MNLAVVAEAAGEKVCIVDLGPKGTAAGWYETRLAETPAVLGHGKVDDFQRTLGRLEAAGFTLAILDPPGQRRPRHPRRHAGRQFVLDPGEAERGRREGRHADPSGPASNGMGQDFALVINQPPVNKQAKSAAAVVMRMSAESVMLPPSVASGVDHQCAYALGHGVSECGPDGKAASEIADLWAGCRKRLEVKHAARRTQRSA